MGTDLISRSAVIEYCRRQAAEPWNRKAAPVTWADAYVAFADDIEEDFLGVDAVELPCKPGEYWRDESGDRVRIETVSFCRSRRLLCDTHMVTYRYEDVVDEFAVNWNYFRNHFTRERTEG